MVHYTDILDKALCSFDFEEGLDGWVRTGTAFDNQPTYGDNPTARNQRQPANQHGDWWIGGYEDRPSKWATAGRSQLDAPQGTLTSPTFDIQGNYISFLIGGGCDIDAIRAELIVDDRVSKTLNLDNVGFTLQDLTKNRLVSPSKTARYHSGDIFLQS